MGIKPVRGWCVQGPKELDLVVMQTEASVFTIIQTFDNPFTDLKVDSTYKQYCFARYATVQMS